MENKAKLTDIIRTAEFNAPIEKVWAAVATSTGLEAWFMPNDFEPVEGHEFHLNAGQFGMSPCKVTKIDPPHSLTFTWGKDWFVTFTLIESKGSTQFTLVHGGWDAERVTEFGAAHTGVRGNMETGWMSLVEEKLRTYVEA